MGYPLMSAAMAAGLYHPRCRDSHTTYFDGISTPPSKKWKKEELEKIEQKYGQEQKATYAKNQAEKFERLEKNALDVDNRKAYNARKEEWLGRCGEAEQVLKTAMPVLAYAAKEVIEVHSVGKIDRDIYKCVTDDIVTDEVVITDNQIQHIKDRHPNDYERFSKYFGMIVSKPDYIVETNKPNTALVLKEIQADNEVFKTVVRLITSKDDPSYKNSIITFMKTDEKEWNRLLRNKKILYKRE